MAPAGHNEAPAIFKKSDGTYWMITSGCTGWDPNEHACSLLLASGDLGHNIQILVVEKNRKSLLADRVRMYFRYREERRLYLLWSDIWRPKHPSDARYIWLPVQFENGIPYIEWMDSWTLDFFNKK